MFVLAPQATTVSGEIISCSLMAIGSFGSLLMKVWHLTGVIGVRNVPALRCQPTLAHFTTASLEAAATDFVSSQGQPLPATGHCHSSLGLAFRCLNYCMSGNLYRFTTSGI